MRTTDEEKAMRISLLSLAFAITALVISMGSVMMAVAGKIG